MDKLKHFKDQIRQALLKDFWNPFELLLTRVNKSSNHYSDLILIGSRHESIRKSIIEGVIPTNDYVVEGNKIRKALLALLEEIGEADLSTLELKDTSVGLVVEKAETIRAISRDTVRGKSVLFLPRVYEVLCAVGLYYFITNQNGYAEVAIELAEEVSPWLGIATVLFWFVVVAFLYFILRITIKAQPEYFTISHRLQIQVVGVQESVLDILIRMNAALGCKIIEVDHENGQLRSHYTRDMKIANKKVFGIAKFGDGVIAFDFVVSDVPDDPLRKEIVITSDFPFDNLPIWIPKETAKRWLMPVANEEINALVEDSFQLMEGYLSTEFGQEKESLEA